MMENMIEIKNLTKYYGKVKGIENLSLSLNKGEIFGFIGPNGAGKSTTIRSMMNLIKKTAGEVVIEGKVFKQDDLEIKKIIGYLPSEINLYDDLSVDEILKYHQSFYKKDYSKKIDELVERLKLDRTKKIEDLSLGNLKKVGIILALMHEPEILILDEPTSGLDPIIQNVFFDLLKEEKAKGTTIIYSTHILNEVSKICDRVGIIKDGHLIKIETIEELIHKNVGYVTLMSPNIQQIIEDLSINPLYQAENTIRFKNPFSDNELIKKLANYQIDKILIEEMNLEDIFYHYYC